MNDIPKDICRDGIPGTICFGIKPKVLYISCKSNTWIACTKVQVQGKKELYPNDFVNGYNLKSGQSRYE